MPVRFEGRSVVMLTTQFSFPIWVHGPSLWESKSEVQGDTQIQVPDVSRKTNMASHVLGVRVAQIPHDPLLRKEGPVGGRSYLEIQAHQQWRAMKMEERKETHPVRVNLTNISTKARDGEHHVGPKNKSNNQTNVRWVWVSWRAEQFYKIFFLRIRSLYIHVIDTLGDPHSPLF